jgi:type IV pilus assembly protein PilA
MIVVAIIGVLAAIAIPNYMLSVLRAKQSEAHIVMGTIKTGQFSFSAAHGCFARIQPNPPAAPGAVRQAWVDGGGFADPCDGLDRDFGDLAIRPTGGSVYFQYACNASFTAVGNPTDDFTCSALGDLDADGNRYELVYCTDVDIDGVGLATLNGTACNFPDEIVRLSPPYF